MKAVTKLVEAAALMLREGVGYSPAPIIPTMPAIRMERTAGMESQERRSRVRGRAHRRVGTAKMPV